MFGIIFCNNQVFLSQLINDRLSLRIIWICGKNLQKVLNILGLKRNYKFNSLLFVLEKDIEVFNHSLNDLLLVL